MQLGLYFDLRSPPGPRSDHRRIYQHALELCERADALGCHSVWLSEHHQFDDGYLPQPLTFAAAIAARTRRLRIGTAVLLAPLRRAPDVAEQAAVVDLLSEGRLDLGVGPGYREVEFELYNADFNHRRTTTDALVRELRTLWSSGGVTPSPAQARVPIWLGYGGPQGARRAGLLGEGLLSANPDLWPAYRDGLTEAGFPPEAGRMAGALPAYVTDDPDRDWPRIKEHFRAQLTSYQRHALVGTAKQGRLIDPDRLRSASLRDRLGAIAFGTPEDVANRIHDYVNDTPVETVFIFADVMAMPEPMLDAHVELLCRQLAPLLAQYDRKDSGHAQL